jgi:hypothetical protein
MHFKPKTARKLASLSALGAGMAMAVDKAEAGIVYSGPIDFRVGFHTFQPRELTSWNSYGLPFYIGNQFVGYGLPNFQALNFSRHFSNNYTNFVWRIQFSNTGPKFGIKSGHLKLFDAGATLHQILLTAVQPFRSHPFTAPRGSVDAFRAYPQPYCLVFLGCNTPETQFGNSAFSNKYALFYFNLSSVTPLFGWVKMSLHVAQNPLLGPWVDILGVAYDNTGATIQAGDIGSVTPPPPPPAQTPEPSTFVSTAFGALALGAVGLRAWRKQREAQRP